MVARDPEPMPADPTALPTPMPYLEDDLAFDAIYPPEIRRVSSRFWTPVATARRGAELLSEAGARAVLDVGSGAGKFALVAGARAPELRVVGIEQRGHLVEVAEEARRLLGLENVRFVHGNVSDAAWSDYDGFYFYNSFAESLFDPGDRLDDRAELSMARFARDVQRATAAMRAAPIGTAVVTFYGSSARIPCSFELVRQEAAGSGWLRLWIKERGTDDGSFFVEDGELNVRHDDRGQPV